jgi:cytochrome c oxidase subunit II
VTASCDSSELGFAGTRHSAARPAVAFAKSFLVRFAARQALPGTFMFVVYGSAVGPAKAQTPLSYLQAYGVRAYPINSLFWALAAISLAVIVMAIVLVLAVIFRGRARSGALLPGRLDVERGPSGIAWLVIGVGTTALILFGASVWTVVTLAAVAVPQARKADLTIEITGHQWWWEVLYKNASPDRQIHTANEIHIPVYRTVAFKLRTADVIHSFWVPSLNGKTDLIPGQINQTWLSASRPGIYRGQCTEYCGRQHAHMGLEVIADAPERFTAWEDHALQPAPAPQTAQEEADLDTFVRKCGACHTVSGTRAGGALGPDLSHLMARRTIAAATLTNTIGNLSGWIADPQHIKPGAYMPRLDISGPELGQVRRFLETLQ